MNQRTVKLLRRYGWLTGWRSRKQIRALRTMWNRLSWRQRNAERVRIVLELERRNK